MVSTWNKVHVQSKQPSLHLYKTPPDQPQKSQEEKLSENFFSPYCKIEKETGLKYAFLSA